MANVLKESGKKMTKYSLSFIFLATNAFKDYTIERSNPNRNFKGIFVCRRKRRDKITDIHLAHKMYVVGLNLKQVA